jgi:hypothetical protein
MATGRKKKSTSRRGRKPSNGSAPDPENAEAGDGGGEGEEDPDAEVEELSPEEKVALFEAYEENLGTVEEVEAALVEAKDNVNDSLKEIFTRAGGGPFRWRGKTVIIAKRGTKYRLEEFSVEIQDIG